MHAAPGCVDVTELWLGLRKFFEICWVNCLTCVALVGDDGCMRRNQISGLGTAVTITANQIVSALRDEGWLGADFVNTGGWVMNVVFAPVCQHGVALGEVCASDNGDWGYGDIDTPTESVGVAAYAPNGDWLGEYGVIPDWTVSDARGAVLAFDQMSYDLERFCPECYADHRGE
jgi:hypothetical protein